MSFPSVVHNARQGVIDYRSVVGPHWHLIPKSYVDAGLLRQDDYGLVPQQLAESEGRPVDRDFQYLHREAGDRKPTFGNGNYVHLPDWQIAKEASSQRTVAHLALPTEIGSIAMHDHRDFSVPLVGNPQAARVTHSGHFPSADPEHPIATIQPKYMQRPTDSGVPVMPAEAPASPTSMSLGGGVFWGIIAVGAGLFIYFRFFHKSTPKAAAPAKVQVARTPGFHRAFSVQTPHTTPLPDAGPGGL